MVNTEILLVFMMDYNFVVKVYNVNQLIIVRVIGDVDLENDDKVNEPVNFEIVEKADFGSFGFTSMICH